MINIRKINKLGPGYIVNTTSKDDFWGKHLSPFYLKNTIEFNSETILSNVENIWQYSKVYKCPQYCKEDHYNEKTFWPTDAYFSWARKGLKQERANRYPAGKGAVPLFSFWKGNKLGYIEARKQIYIPMYAEALVKSPAYIALKELYNRGTYLTFQDFDGYNHNGLGMTYSDVLHCEQRKMGHSFVIAMLLDNFIDETGQVL